MHEKRYESFYSEASIGSCNVVLTFVPVDEIFNYVHSMESYSCGIVYYAVQGGYLYNLDYGNRIPRRE